MFKLPAFYPQPDFRITHPHLDEPQEVWLVDSPRRAVELQLPSSRTFCETCGTGEDGQLGDTDNGWVVFYLEPYSGITLHLDCLFADGTEIYRG